MTAWALFAEVAREWTDIEESNKGEEFSNAVLKRSAGEAPFMICLQGKACLCTACGTLLKGVSDE
jgi:hypothetical protein